MIKLTITATFWIKEENLDMIHSKSDEVLSYSKIDPYTLTEYEFYSLSQIARDSENAMINNHCLRVLDKEEAEVSA